MKVDTLKINSNVVNSAKLSNNGEQHDQPNFRQGVAILDHATKHEDETLMKNLLPLPGIANYTIAVLAPKSFDEAKRAIEALKAGTVILFNLAGLGPKQAQRYADFASGSTCALAGHETSIGQHVFLYAPPTVEIKTQI